MTDTHENHSFKQNNQPCCFFEIHVRGHLSSEWSDWFENMDIKLLENGETVLSGPIVDQAALLGILNKLNRLNLTLLSLNEVSRNQNIKEGERNGATASTESQI
jgi:hypothetical protein